MLFCRLLPTVFMLLSATVLASPLYAAQPDTSGAALKGAEPKADTAVMHAPVGHVDSGAFLSAVIAVRRGDDLQAARSFRQAAAADPQNMELLKQAFVRSVMAGDADAVPLAHKLDKLPGAQSVISALVLGNDAAVRGEWGEALTYYHQARTDPLTHLIMPLLLAWCEQAQGHANEAVESLTHIQKSVLVPFYTLHAALIAQVAGQTDRAGQLFDETRKIMPGGDLLLTRSYAAWLWEHGQKEKARAELRKLEGDDPVLLLAGPQLQATISHFPVTSARGGIARAYILTAFLLRQQGREQAQQAAATGGMVGNDANLYQFNEAARLMLGFALAMDPTLAEACLMLAEIQIDEDHGAAARETLLRVPQSDPMSPVARLRLAVLDSTPDQATEAVSLLRPLVAQLPDQILLQRALGNALVQQKDWKGAIAAYTKAIDLATAQKDVDWTLLFLRAMVYHEMGDWPHARDDARAALAYAPDESMLLNFLGYSMVERHENLPEAEKLLRKAHQLSPDDAAITDSLGWVRAERGDLNEALELLEKAAEKTPEDPEVNYHLGEVYWRQGRKTEAIDQWNVALGLHPIPSDEVLIRAALKRAGVEPDVKKADQAAPAKAAPQDKGTHTP